MEILVLGSSNSILADGYLAGLADELPGAVISNKSVGASPGLQFAYYCGLDFRRYDAVIFDAVVNDENIEPFLGAVNYQHEILRQIFSTIASQTRLVVLGFCNRRFLQVRSPVHLGYERLAKEAGAEFLSVREFALDQGPEIAGDGAPLFDDESHLDQQVAKAFGRRLAGHLATAPDVAPKPASYADRFGCIGIEELCRGVVYRKSNSLLTMSFIDLKHRHEIVFPEPRFLVGFYVDARNTSGFIGLDGPQSRRVMRLHYWLDDGFQALFVPIADGALTSRLTVLDHADHFEDGPHCVAQTQSGVCNVAISGFAWWSPSTDSLTSGVSSP